MYDEMLTAITADAARQEESNLLGLGFCEKYCKGLGYKSDRASFKQCKAECGKNKKAIKDGSYSIAPSAGQALEDELRKPIEKKGLSAGAIGLIVFALLLLIALIMIIAKRMRRGNG